MSSVAAKLLLNQTTGFGEPFQPRAAALGGNLLADLAWHVRLSQFFASLLAWANGALMSSGRSGSLGM